MGSVDTVYLQAQEDDRAKRGAVGIYAESGLSQYVVPNTSAPVGSDQNTVYPEGEVFPNNFDPRYTLYRGTTAFPDHKANYQVNKQGPRVPAVALDDEGDNYVANPEDSPQGFVVNGTLPVGAPQGVHSLVDVSVFARGPCQMDFAGVYSNIDVFFKIADCLGLSRYEAPGSGSGDISAKNQTWQSWEESNDDGNDD